LDRFYLDDTDLRTGQKDERLDVDWEKRGSDYAVYASEPDSEGQTLFEGV
jgi:hypothetical protein